MKARGTFFQPEIPPRWRALDGEQWVWRTADEVIALFYRDDDGREYTIFGDGAVMRAMLVAQVTEGWASVAWWAQEGDLDPLAFPVEIEGWPGRRTPQREELDSSLDPAWWPVVEAVFADRVLPAKLAETDEPPGVS